MASLILTVKVKIFLIIMKQENIRVIIGLGNPGISYKKNRHNIGFQILDRLADRYNAQFQEKDNFEKADIVINSLTNRQLEYKVLLIKPQTFMNNSGQVMPYLKKYNIKPEEVLVIHDELELPFGKVALKLGGSAKGHNGLKSIIASIGQDFWRLRFGISRPEEKSQVPEYVLQNFNKSQQLELDNLINQAINLIVDKFYL